MATTLQNLIDDTRSMLVEPSPRYFSATEVTRWINQGVRNFSSKVLWYEKISGIAVTANQVEYALPVDCMKIELIVYNEAYRIRVVDESEWMQYKYVRANQTSVIPFFALPYPFDRRLALLPAPQATSAATILANNINATATTIPVASTTSFPSQGRFIVGTEQIRYYATDATNFLQCVRGEGDTTAVNHSQGDAANYCSLILHVRSMPPDLVLGPDITKLPDEYAEAIIWYATHKGLMKRGTNDDFQRAQAFLQKYTAIRDEAADDRMEEQKDGTSGIHDEETGMGFYSDI